MILYRCGLDNCQLFRSWADPKADCCVFAFQLRQETTPNPISTSVAAESQTDIAPEPIIVPEVETSYDETSKKDELKISSEEYDIADFKITAWTTADDVAPRISYLFTFDLFDIPGGDETCSDAWVMILEGNTLTTDPEVILKKTCNANKQINLPEMKIQTELDKSTIYFKNDGTGMFNVTRTRKREPKAAIFSEPKMLKE